MDRGAWRATAHGVTENMTEQLTLTHFMPEQPSQGRGGKGLTGSCTEARPRETWIFSC